jgi:D-threonate/D-erythronate kinase
MLILAIADDTTGALEVGAKFAAQGVRAVVTTDLTNWPEAPAIVIDTQSRHMEPAQARDRVAAVAVKARDAGVSYLYKKTDSTLRGNIASEFQALLDTFPERTLFYVPAYPAMGRVVVNGELYVNGLPLSRTAFAQDPLNPSRESSIAALLGQTGFGSIVVCDGTSDDDLRASAIGLARFGQSHIAAGTGGFVDFWAGALPLERGYEALRPAAQRCLVLSGSLHPASMEQVRQGTAAGIATLYLSDNPPELDAALSASPWVALATPGTCPQGVSERIGALARCALEGGLIDGLVVYGGDTAFAVLQALQVSVVESCGDLLPGIPLSLLRFGGREVALVTKAGGFGGPDTLLSIRRQLEDRS